MTNRKKEVTQNAKNIIVTKEQKQASKVADMLAIKELDDYKHFVDYSDSKDTFKKTEESKQITPKNELVEQIIKNRTKNTQTNTQQAN